jgi:hypothetical protein
MGRRSFVTALTVVLVAQFSVFVEVFATMTLVGAVVGVATFLAAKLERRRSILQTGRLVALSYLLALILVSPFLYTMFAYPHAVKPPSFSGLAAGARTTGDVLRFVRPMRAFALTSIMGSKPATTINFWYLGLPLVLVLIAFWATQWRSRLTWVLAFGLVAAVVLAIGAHLPLGRLRIPLPWLAFERLPLLGHAREGRFIVYAYLFAAVSVARFAARAYRRRWVSVLTWAAALLVVASLVPNFARDTWSRANVTPAFFASREYRAYISPGEVVMYVGRSNAKQVLWQTAADLEFRTVTWYPGFLPSDYPDVATALRFKEGRFRPEDGPLLERFLVEHQTGAILVWRVPHRQHVIDLLSSLLGVQPETVGKSLTLFRLAAPGAP